MRPPEDLSDPRYRGGYTEPDSDLAQADNHPTHSPNISMRIVCSSWLIMGTWAFLLFGLVTFGWADEVLVNDTRVFEAILWGIGAAYLLSLAAPAFVVLLFSVVAQAFSTEDGVLKSYVWVAIGAMVLYVLAFFQFFLSIGTGDLGGWLLLATATILGGGAWWLMVVRYWQQHAPQNRSYQLWEKWVLLLVVLVLVHPVGSTLVALASGHSDSIGLPLFGVQWGLFTVGSLGLLLYGWGKDHRKERWVNTLSWATLVVSGLALSPWVIFTVTGKIIAFAGLLLMGATGVVIRRMTAPYAVYDDDLWNVPEADQNNPYNGPTL